MGQAGRRLGRWRRIRRAGRREGGRHRHETRQRGERLVDGAGEAERRHQRRQTGVAARSVQGRTGRSAETGERRRRRRRAVHHRHGREEGERRRGEGGQRRRRERHRRRSQSAGRGRRRATTGRSLGQHLWTRWSLRHHRGHAIRFQNRQEFRCPFHFQPQVKHRVKNE